MNSYGKAMGAFARAVDRAFQSGVTLPNYILEHPLVHFMSQGDTKPPILATSAVFEDIWIKEWETKPENQEKAIWMRNSEEKKRLSNAAIDWEDTQQVDSFVNDPEANWEGANYYQFMQEQNRYIVERMVDFLTSIGQEEIPPEITRHLQEGPPLPPERK